MFKLTIHLGNDAMQTPDDVSRALLKLAAYLADRDDEQLDGSILDANGNSVGRWSFAREEQPAPRRGTGRVRRGGPDWGL